MSFKIKNSQLSNESLDVINKLLEQDIDASAAFKLTRIIKFISPIVEDKLSLEKKIYNKWIQIDEDGKPISAKDENGDEIPDTVLLKDVDKFSKEMSDLYEIENEIPFDKIAFDNLGLKTAKIKDLIKIDYLFE
jgi:hypothetical protein